ncbi:hypothetical protein B5F53_04270 [Blautia sp. An249]|uniref:YkvI family membrane protein n=1 Tax=Blautia sp. An249 TaxID=1965603 RepID=UPI000B399310|nr:hypothetical protein [Blautia sp. An249]OUO80187.1 hypothetical protein B5F53_04270 [Blautia sp. An249]
MGENKIRLREIIILGGAYISYGVGASFGTGISLLQYHGALGVWGILSQLISCVLTITLIYVVSKDCGTYHLHSMDGMFSHYCGKYLGTIFRWYTVVMLFLMTGTMFAGAAETMHETYSIPNWAGTVIMLAAVIGTIILGAKKLIDIIGNIAPVILVVMLIICLYSLIFHSDSMAEGSEIIRQSAESIRITGNPVAAGFLEFGLVIMMTTGYLATVAAREGTSKKELLVGNVSGEGSLFVFKIMLIFAFILNASVISGSSVPVVTLGSQLGGWFGKLYGIILVLAVYTTAVGMAWQVVINICPETSKWYKPLCIVVTLAAYGFTFLGPFAVLMQVVNMLCSYVGVVFIACLFYTKIVRQKKMEVKK